MPTLNTCLCFVVDYTLMYKESIEKPDQFWGKQARLFLEWTKTFTAVNECSKEEGVVRWFTGGQLNVTSKLMCTTDV